MANPFTDVAEALPLCSTNKRRKARIFFKLGGSRNSQPVFDDGLCMVVSIRVEEKPSFVPINHLTRGPFIDV